MTIRIAVDAQSLSETVAGIGRVTVETLSRMSREGHKWFLYSSRPIPPTDWFGSNICIRHVDLQTRGLGFLWSQTVLPYWAFQDRVDLFWSPAHRLPRLLSNKIACVVTIHDMVWRHAGQTMRPLNCCADKILMPEAVRLADRVIAVSEHTAFDLENEFPHASGKITVVPLGVAKFGDSSDLDEFPESVAKSNRPFFLFVGTHEPRKNLRRLVEAYAILPENIKELADLVVVGGKGWGDVDVDGLANEQGVSQRVKALGYVTDRQLFSLYTRALFLAMPSLYEGFGLPLVEAMSVGTPVLTSNVSSMPEVAGKAAVLVDPESVKSISDGLKKLLLEENFRITLGKIAKKQTSQISWDLTANRTLDVFKQAIAARKERRRKN